MSSADDLIDLRCDGMPRAPIDIIDAVVQATPGATRTSVVRQILAEWAARKVHESTVVLRVARANALGADDERSLTGRGLR